MEHGALGIEHRAKRVVVNTRNVVLPVFAQVVVFKKSPYICSREAGGGCETKSIRAAASFTWLSGMQRSLPGLSLSKG
jgi:hypothetical protein